jgi:hypothetical protein
MNDTKAGKLEKTPEGTTQTVLTVGSFNYVFQVKYVVYGLMV